MPRKLLAQNLSQADPLVAGLLAAEDLRQAEKLIMIASESITPPAVRQAADSALISLYAEGYPHPRMSRSPEGHLGAGGRAGAVKAAGRAAAGIVGSSPAAAPRDLKPICADGLGLRLRRKASLAAPGLISLLPRAIVASGP